MRAALTIALKDLRQRTRDRSFFITAIVAPLALALLFGLMFGEPPEQEAYQLSARYGVVDLDDEAVGDYFVDFHVRPVPGVSVIDVATVAQAAEMAEGDPGQFADRSAELDAVFVIPEGFAADVQSERPVELQVIGNRLSPTEAGLAVQLARGYASDLSSVRVATATFENLLGAGVDRREVGFEILQTPLALEVVEEVADERSLDGATYYAVGMTIFFLFFTVQFGVLNLLQERDDGTMRRLLAAPLPRGSIIAGKMLTSIIAGLVSATVLVVATSYAVGAEWGDPMAVAALVVAFVIAATGIAALVGGFARTNEQAQFLASNTATVLGLLGGAFFPLALAGGWIERLQVVSPHAWFIRAMTDLSVESASAVVFPAIVLLAIGVITGALAITGLARRLQP